MGPFGYFIRKNREEKDEFGKVRDERFDIFRFSRDF